MDEELLGKQLPQSLEAEQAVLGSILIDSRCIADVIGILRPEDFYLPQNRQIFEAVYSMFNFSQSIDPVTVLDKMREMGVYQDNSRDYIMQLMEITPTAANVVRYANIVRDKAMLRGLAQAATEISETVYSQVGTPAEMLEAAEKKIYALRKGERGDSLEHIGTVLHKYFDRLTELSQSDSMIPGMSTGLQDLDRRIKGLNNSNLILVAARPSMGKSAFALNLATNVAKKYKKTVAVFNLEMSREEIAKRIVASEGLINMDQLNTGKLTEDEWNKLCVASAALSQTDIRIDDNPTVTVADISAKCRRLDNLGLIVIDYLQLMMGSGYGKGSSGENRVQVVGEISRALKIMAKDLNVPVICLSQLSRASESRTDKRPILSDLRESGAIEQDADIVMALYRDEYYNRDDSENKGIAECIVLKNRQGETGVVELQWMGQYQLFSDKEWKHD
jgi:replicative DNA helicase